MRSLRISIALADRCVATSNTLPLLEIHCPARPFELDWELYEQEQRVSLRSTLGASAPLRLSTLEAQALLIGLSAMTPLLGKELSAHVPHAALVVCALGGLKRLTPTARGSDSVSGLVEREP